MRLKHKVSYGSYVWKIYRDSTYNEFCVKMTRDTGALASTYHTDDMADARATTAAQIRSIRRKGAKCS